MNRCSICDTWYSDEEEADHLHFEPQSGDPRDSWLASRLPYDRWVRDTPEGRHWAFREHRRRLSDMVERFLHERRTSDGGWAEVCEGDVDALRAIISLLIEIKFEPDPDGDAPVEFLVVDRTTHQSMHFVPLRYTTWNDKKGGESPLETLAGAATLNLRLAAEDVDRLTRMIQFERQEKSS